MPVPGGGLSNKGAGEKKLELDRRRIEKRISELNRELKVMEKDRETQRKRRKESELPSVALVGYTNAGKSTLMNKMLDIWMGDTGEKGSGKGYAVRHAGYDGAQNQPRR